MDIVWEFSLQIIQVIQAFHLMNTYDGSKMFSYKKVLCVKTCETRKNIKKVEFISFPLLSINSYLLLL